MKRAFAPLLLLLLAGCPDRTPPAPPPPPEPPRVGEVYVYELLGGGRRLDEVASVGTETITLHRSVKLGAEESPPSTVVEPLAGPSPSASITPDMKSTKGGGETLVISGRSFDCEIRELKVGTQTVREWVAARWPFVVRTRSGNFQTLALVAIQDPKKEPAK